MPDTYLKGPKLRITYQDYDDERIEHVVIVNGKAMTIDEFRRIKAGKGKKNHVGMGLWVTKKSP